MGNGNAGQSRIWKKERRKGTVTQWEAAFPFGVALPLVAGRIFKGVFVTGCGR